MREREPRKETIGKGELYFLEHPGTEDVFSGYGLTMQPGSKEFLVGLLMIDRPHPADSDWLQEVEARFGEYQLVPMTPADERGIACQMQIEPDSLPHLCQYPGGKADAIKTALEPLLEDEPNPVFSLRWDAKARLWRSRFAPVAELPAEIREVFEKTGYGCLAAETNIGVVRFAVVRLLARNAYIGYTGRPPPRHHYTVRRNPTTRKFIDGHRILHRSTQGPDPPHVPHRTGDDPRRRPSDSRCVQLLPRSPFAAADRKV